MFEEMMENFRKELKKEMATFVKHGVKSPNLAKGQRFLGLDNEDLLKLCKGSL